MKKNQKVVFIVVLLWAMVFSTILCFGQTEDYWDMSLEDLLDMDISAASMTSEKMSDAPGVVYVFTRTDIERTGAKTLVDILNLVPGFDVVRSSGITTHENIQVRGKASIYSESVLILVDGVRQTDLHYGSSVVIPRFYNLHNVERIEIIRGPGSALYGAGAFSGVVSIITRSAKTNDKFVANAEFGDFDTSSGSLYKGYKTDTWGISAALQYSDEDGEKYKNLLTKFNRIYERTEDPVEDYEFNLKAHYDNDNFNSEIGLKMLSRESTDFIPDGWRDQTPPADGTDSKVNTLYGDFSMPFLEKGEAHLHLNAIDIEGKNYYQLFRPEELPPGHEHAESGRGGLAGPYYQSKLYTAELQVSWDFTNHFLIGGISKSVHKSKHHWGWSNMDLSQLFPPGLFDPKPEYTKFNISSDEDRDIFSLYLQDTFNLTDKIKTTVGARYDDYDDVGDTFNPRLAVVYTPQEDTSIKFLAASAFRAPSYAELYHHNNPSSIGNPDLDPEKIKTFELFAQKTFEKKLQVSAGVFHSRIKDVITTVTQPGSIAEFVNFGKQEMTGFELETKFIYDHRNYFTLNYTYTKTKDKETRERLPNISRHNINAILSLGITKYLDFVLSGYYRHERDRAEGDMREEVDNYGIVNLKLAGNINDNFKVYIKGNNVFDKSYYGPEAIDLVPGDTPYRGRAYYFGAEAKF